SRLPAASLVPTRQSGEWASHMRSIGSSDGRTLSRTACWGVPTRASSSSTVVISVVISVVRPWLVSAVATTTGRYGPGCRSVQEKWRRGGWHGDRALGPAPGHGRVLRRGRAAHPPHAAR